MRGSGGIIVLLLVAGGLVWYLFFRNNVPQTEAAYQKYKNDFWSKADPAGNLGLPFSEGFSQDFIPEDQRYT